MKRITTRLVLTLALIATPALADENCVVPMTDWQPREAVMKLAAEQGWVLRRIRIDDGCYEVIGRDAAGRAIEVKLNPATLAVVEMEFEDDHDEDGAEHEDGGDD
ncbi:COG5591 Uncharacterized conserved protein [Paracoccaceae bacterium]|jgi:hypothetical protein